MLPFIAYKHVRLNPSSSIGGDRAPTPSPERMKELKDRFIKKFTTVDENFIENIRKLDQHRADGTTNQKWLDSRRFRCTGSRIAGIIGENPYSSANKTLKDLIWCTFKGNCATQYGTNSEDNAQETYMNYLKYLIAHHHEVAGWILVDASIENMGLVIDNIHPQFAMSPDGVVTLTWVQKAAPGTDDTMLKSRIEKRLVEFKCPYKHRGGIEIEKRSNFYPLNTTCYEINSDRNLELIPIPKYYQCQIQWGMGVLRDRLLKGNPLKTDFVVWCPSTAKKTFLKVSDDHKLRCASGMEYTHVFSDTSGSIEVTVIEENQSFISSIRSKVQKFWEMKYIPCAIYKQLGCLYPGDLQPPVSIEIPFHKKKKCI